MNLLEENNTSFKQRYTFRRDNWQADGANSKRALTYPVGWLLVQWFRFSFCQENSVQRAQLLLLVRKTALMPAYIAQPLIETPLLCRQNKYREWRNLLRLKENLPMPILRQYFLFTTNLHMHCLSFLLSFPLGKLQLIIFGGKIRNSTFRDQKKGRGRRRQSATVFLFSWICARFSAALLVVASFPLSFFFMHL